MKKIFVLIICVLALSAHAQEPDVARKPEKWRWDTALELRDLAEGITREQGQELRR